MAVSDMTTERNMKLALARGAKLRCPRCGEGRLFNSYLKVSECCPSCGLDYTPQRADDGPAYLVILVVGHLVGFALPVMFEWMRDDPALLALSVGSLAIALSLLLLPRVKGGFVAFQWAKSLHGF